METRRGHIMKPGYTYIMTNKVRTTFYVGVTSDLVRRIWQHRETETKGFASRYNVRHLVWYECFDDIREAISREKNLKNWQRDWKVDLVAKFNPEWCDLYSDILGLRQDASSPETPGQARSDGVCVVRAPGTLSIVTPASEPESL
jgi:putative endonuclease